jgi:hypothetical protein
MIQRILTCQFEPSILAVGRFGGPKNTKCLLMWTETFGYRRWTRIVVGTVGIHFSLFARTSFSRGSAPAETGHSFRSARSRFGFCSARRSARFARGKNFCSTTTQTRFSRGFLFKYAYASTTTGWSRPRHGFLSLGNRFGDFPTMILTVIIIHKHDISDMLSLIFIEKTSINHSS